MDTTTLAVVRTVFYLALLFLIAFDIPAAHDRQHRVVLVAMMLWLLMLLMASLSLVLLKIEAYVWIRDVGLTITTGLVLASHLYWLNRRGNKK